MGSSLIIIISLLGVSLIVNIVLVVAVLMASRRPAVHGDDKTDEFFSRLGQLLASTTDLRGLLEQTSQQIDGAMNTRHTLFVLRYRKDDVIHHMTAGSSGRTKLPMHDVEMIESYTDRSILHVSALERGNPLKRMLTSHHIAIVVPLRRDNQTAGYMLLGDKKEGRFSRRDLALLATISDELAIAIQNALSLHEVRELNATLQQRIDVATKELRSSNAQLRHLDEVKDEFMSMASHQLRTPLTSVKGYVSMVIEGDAGKITAQQRKLLLEAFNSSERMVHLIADFLNVSRLQTGKFAIDKTTFDIKKLVRDEVESLKLVAAAHDMKLRLTVTDQPLTLIADESKIRQVIMNFIDNAIFYSPKGGTITINLERVNDQVALTVIDTGIGVPEAEQSRLFGKFFRAANARRQRPDGTGIGLYLARRVITGHNGSIIFSSKEGKGSTFGFRLPIDSTAANDTTPKA